jgi:hypothetical protein
MSLDPSTLAALLSAGAVRSIGIVRRCAWWEVWVRVGQTLAESSSEPIHTAPGGVRQWAAFEAAYTFVRDQGYRGTVEVDDAVGSAIGSAPDRANAGQAATPYTTESLPVPQKAVQAVSGPETPRGKGLMNARSPLALTTPPKKSTTTPPRTTRSTPRPLSGPHRSTRPPPRPAPKDPQG